MEGVEVIAGDARGGEEVGGEGGREGKGNAARATAWSEEASAADGAKCSVAKKRVRMVRRRGEGEREREEELVVGVAEK
jgi:hypothetical protein